MNNNSVQLPESLVNCSICFSPYDTEDHVPLVGTCGHTICARCTQSLENRNCPTCRAPDSYRKPSKNFIAYDLIEHKKLLEKTCADVARLQQNAAGPSREQKDLIGDHSRDWQRLNQNALSLAAQSAIQKQLGGLSLRQLQQSQSTETKAVVKSTILLLGKSPVILSADKKEWRKLKLKLPYDDLSGATVHLNGQIYFLGAYNNPKALYKLDYDLKWQRLADMNIGRRKITTRCLAWNGYILVFGGWNPKYCHKSSYLKTVERYDPSKNEWTLIQTAMRDTGCGNTPVIWNGKIISTSSLSYYSTSSMEVEIFNPRSIDERKFLQRMPPDHFLPSLIIYKNKLIALSGESGRAKMFRLPPLVDRVLELDPAERMGKWRSLPNMKCLANHFAAVNFDEEIYKIGGRGDNCKDLDRVEIFDGERWRDGPALPEPMCGMTALIIPQSLIDRLCNLQL